MTGDGTIVPAQAALTTSAATLTAANPSPTTTVTVQARDAGGNNVSTGGATVALTPSAGSIGSNQR